METTTSNFIVWLRILSGMALTRIFFKLIMTYDIVFFIVDPSPSALMARVSHRLTYSYSPKTSTSYRSMFITFMAFCEFVNTDILSLKLSTILMFIEFLAYNGLKHVSILNYISAIKAQLKWFELPATVFEHDKVKHMLKAVNLSIRNF